MLKYFFPPNLCYCFLDYFLLPSSGCWRRRGPAQNGLWVRFHPLIWTRCMGLSPRSELTSNFESMVNNYLCEKVEEWAKQVFVHYMFHCIYVSTFLTILTYIVFGTLWVVQNSVHTGSTKFPKFWGRLVWALKWRVNGLRALLDNVKICELWTLPLLTQPQILIHIP